MAGRVIHLAERIEAVLRRLNHLLALVLGVVLVATVIFILIDVGLRGLGYGSLGGSNEISGYVMTALSSWGLAFALVERAHVRIDILRQMIARPGQVAMDLLAIIVTNAVVLLVAWQCWPVLEKTLARGSRANTPLETPLWIPQGIWFGGWVWFALTVTLLTLIGLTYLAAGRMAAFDATLGMTSEIDEELEAASRIGGKS